MNDKDLSEYPHPPPEDTWVPETLTDKMLLHGGAAGCLGILAGSLEAAWKEPKFVDKTGGLGLGFQHQSTNFKTFIRPIGKFTGLFLPSALVYTFTKHATEIALNEKEGFRSNFIGGFFGACAAVFAMRQRNFRTYIVSGVFVGLGMAIPGALGWKLSPNPKKTFEETFKKRPQPYNVPLTKEEIGN